MPRSVQNNAWNAFVDWCRRRGLSAVPANPWTLAAYVRWSEPHHTPRAIAKMIKEISRVHETKTRKRLDRDPLVKRTLGMIETRHSVKREQPRVDLFEDGAEGKSPRPGKRTATAAPKRPSKPTRSTKPKPKPTPKSSSRVKSGLSATPRLVPRRRLKS